MIGCLLDPIGCVTDGFWQWVGSIAWYWWALLAAIVVGIVWKLAGWPGLLGLAGAVGFILGRRDSSKEDDIWPDPDKPVRSAPRKPLKPSSDPLARRPGETIADFWERTGK